ncbi:LPXTG-motif cell wall anchor domain-containing protein [Lachnospiraceae bacterium NK3A20]|nr:LPXTG-motif cell wall anchor domain-containing protein [Lachnospiraceae bacterium NK3A20]
MRHGKIRNRLLTTVLALALVLPGALPANADNVAEAATVAETVSAEISAPQDAGSVGDAGAPQDTGSAIVTDSSSSETASAPASTNSADAAASYQSSQEGTIATGADDLSRNGQTLAGEQQTIDITSEATSDGAPQTAADSNDTDLNAANGTTENEAAATGTDEGEAGLDDTDQADAEEGLTIPDGETLTTELPEEGLTKEETTGEKRVRRAAGARVRANLGETEWIKGIKVSKLNTGTGVWEQGTVFENGDHVRIEIQYSIPKESFTSSDAEIYYELPDGVSLEQEQSGTVYARDGSQIGTYFITTDGKITVEFNDQFDTTIVEDGTINLEGMLQNESVQEDKSLSFPGSGTSIIIHKKQDVVVPPQDNDDISVRKSSRVSSDKRIITYTVKVSTEKGTSGTVNLIDAFRWEENATEAYDPNSFTIYRINKAGTQSPLDINVYHPDITKTDSGRETFTIRNLPQLQAGESYQIQYDAKVNPLEGRDGMQKVNNSIKAESGGDNSHHDITTDVSDSMVSKNGYASDGRIHWTIRVNADRRDLSGYRLSDSLPDGLTLKGDLVIRDENQGWENVSGLTSAGEGATSLDIDFSQLSEDRKTHTFNITYDTTAPAVGEDSSVEVENTAKLTGKGNSYQSTAKVHVASVKITVNKKVDSAEEKALEDGRRQYRWWSTLNLPATETSGFLYEDEIGDAVSQDENGQKTGQGADSHYTTDKQLREDLGFYKNRHLKYVGDNGARAEYEEGKDYRYVITTYDAAGNRIPENDGEQHVKSFTVWIEPLPGKTISPLSLDLNYSTFADTRNIQAGETWNYYNTGKVTEFNGRKVDGANSTASASHSVKKQLWKQASLTGQNGSYSAADLSGVNLTEQNGLVYYRILLTLDKDTKGEITVDDVLSKGLKFREDTFAAAFYDHDWWTHPSNNNGSYDLSGAQKPTVEVSSQEDGSTKLSIHIPDGYEQNDGQVIQLTYQASVLDDEDWNDMSRESKAYYNTASWGERRDSHATTFERKVETIEKLAKQLKDENGNSTDTVEYTVPINPAGKDLNPNGSTVLLKDHLTVPTGVRAYLDLTKTGLYRYDSRAENHIGPKLDSSLYKLSYDDEEHEITVEIADAQAAVLVYRYNIDRGNYDTPEISNRAELAGSYSSTNSIKLNKNSSSATIYGKQLVLFKVDLDDFTKFLPGAEFTIEERENSEWQLIEPRTVTSGDKLVTDAAGKLTLTNLKENTLYRIRETHPPEGYTISGKPIYVIWTNGEHQQEDLYTSLDDAVKSEIGNVVRVHFISDVGGYLYIPNSFTNLRVEKRWLNKDGTPGEPGDQAVAVHLYSTTKMLNAVTVKVQVKDPWGGSQNVSEQVARGTGVRVYWGDYQTSDIAYVKINDALQDGSPAIGTVSYTSAPIEGDTSIEIGTSGWTSMPRIAFERPQYQINPDDRKLVATINLSGEDNWEKTWTDLPRYDENGNELVYFVEEDPVEGYNTSYANNNGTQTGNIMIINRRNSDDYQLPQTGGRNLFLLLFGAVSVLIGAAWLYGMRYNWRS